MIQVYKDNTSSSQIATITKDATNLTLSWTKAGTPGNNLIVLNIYVEL